MIFTITDEEKSFSLQELIRKLVRGAYMSRDDFIIELVEKHGREKAKEFLAIYDGVKSLEKEKRETDKEYNEDCLRLENAIRKLRSQCTHPLVWADSGGQYQKSELNCHICGASGFRHDR